jgi:hypothetical protein
VWRTRKVPPATSGSNPVISGICRKSEIAGFLLSDLVLCLTAHAQAWTGIWGDSTVGRRHVVHLQLSPGPIPPSPARSGPEGLGWVWAGGRPSRPNRLHPCMVDARNSHGRALGAAGMPCTGTHNTHAHTRTNTPRFRRFAPLPPQALSSIHAPSQKGRQPLSPPTQGRYMGVLYVLKDTHHPPASTLRQQAPKRLDFGALRPSFCSP